jgi:hypothetical protein
MTSSGSEFPWTAPFEFDYQWIDPAKEAKEFRDLIVEKVSPRLRLSY